MKTEILYLKDKRFKIKIRQFEIETDLPKDMKGTDLAPNPPELFIASLGSCAGVFVLNYVTNVLKKPLDSLKIEVNWEFALAPRRIGKIDIKIDEPFPLDDKMKEHMLQAAQLCTVHNTLTIKPEINIRIE